MIVSIDGGTTNTRLTLIDNGKVLSTVKIGIGAGNHSASSSGNPYFAPLREGLQSLMRQNSISQRNVSALVCSGMIGSENGLYFVPYIPTPANAKAAAQNLECVNIPEITNLPIYFVPGVKTQGDLPVDIMRGEETELFGICHKLNAKKFTAVMPGSHTKIVSIGENGEITSFKTAMTGELIRASAEHTILRTLLYDVFPKELDEECLFEGFTFCEGNGINQSLFEVRIRQKYSDLTPAQLFAFLCGVCLHGDIKPILDVSDGGEIYVGGSDPFRCAYVSLLQRSRNEPIFKVPDDISEHAAAYGAQLLMELRNKKE